MSTKIKVETHFKSGEPRMTVARLVTVMAIVFIGLFAFQNCGQSKKAMTLVSDTSVSSTTGVLEGTYSVTTWTCNQKDILQALSYAGATSVSIVIGSSGGSVTQTVSFGATCSSTETLPLTFNSVSSLTLTQGAVTCGTACSATQCQSVAGSSSPSSMTLSYTKSVDSKTVTLTRKLTSLDVTNTGWPYGGAGCGVGNLVTFILSK